MPKKPEAVVEEAEVVDEIEAKRQRKATKRAAKEAAAAAAALAPEEEEAVDEAEAKRQRKAAKKAAHEAAAVAAENEEVDEAEAKRQRKAAKKVAKLAAATAEQDVGETPKKSKKEKRAQADEDDEEAPKAKKSKTVADAEGEQEQDSKAEKGKDGKGKSKGKGKGGKSERNNENTIYVRGLPFTVTEEVMRKDFAECGEFSRLSLPLNEEGRPKGTCFITYKTQEGVDAALKFDGTEYGGRLIYVSKAGEPSAAFSGGKGNAKGGKTKDVRDNENTVFLRGLPWSVTEETLKKDFAECGEIERLSLPLNEEGKPRGICFMKFKTPEGVDAALKFDDTDYGGRTLNVSKAEEGKGKGKGKGKDGKGKDGKSKGKKSTGKAPSDD